MPKLLRVGTDARKEGCRALETIAKAVGSTLGPSGRPFFFERLGADQRHRATTSKDGLTVLNSLEMDHPLYRAVHYFSQQSAAHTVIDSGDGTTSTIVLASAVANAVQGIEKHNRLFFNKQLLPQAFARQLKEEARRCVEAITKEVIKDKEIVRKVALTSANGDQELVDVVMDAISQTSAFGTIVVEKLPASKVRYKITKQDGYSGCKGYNYNNTFALSCDDRAAENAPFDWESPYIFIFNGHLLIGEQLEPILKAYRDAIANTGRVRKLVIVTYETSDEIMNKLIVFNRTSVKSGAGVFIAKPRLSAEINSGLQIVRDLAAYTDANIIDGGNYKITTPTDFGTCGKVRFTPTQTIFFGRANNHWVEKRVVQNQNLVEAAESPFDKEITSIRNAELAEGLVKVEIGGGMLPNLQERADRFDDASKAAQSCMRSGALPGCGASYIRAGDIAGVSKPMKHALRVIHDTIMENFGANPIKSFGPAETVKISDNGCTRGDFRDLNVVDAAATVCSVIENGVELGILVATQGGYSLLHEGQHKQAISLEEPVMF